MVDTSLIDSSSNITDNNDHDSDGDEGDASGGECASLMPLICFRHFKLSDKNVMKFEIILKMKMIGKTNKLTVRGFYL